MNANSKMIYQNLTHMAVLIKDESHALHSAVVEVERKIVRINAQQLVRTVGIASIQLKNIVYKRINERFISDHGAEIFLIDKM